MSETLEPTSPPATCAATRPHCDTRFLFTAMTIAALWIAMFAVTTVGGKILLAIFGLTYLFGCWRTRRAVLLVLPAMYLPYLWLVWDWTDWPWHSYRWQWIAIWWQLPGLLVEMTMHPLSESWFAFVTTVASLAAFFSFIMLARVSWGFAWITCVIVLLLSSVNSLFCLAIYRV